MFVVIEVYKNEHRHVAGMVAGEDVLEDLAFCVSHMISAQDVEHCFQSRDGRASGGLILRHLLAWGKQVEGSRDEHELGILFAYCLPQLLCMLAIYAYSQNNLQEVDDAKHMAAVRRDYAFDKRITPLICIRPAE